MALALCIMGQAQTEIYTANTGNEKEPDFEKICITVGILNGGGALVGADLEVKIIDHVGIQAGAGFVGYGGGINFHFKKQLRSSFLSLQYFHQGIGESYIQSMIGPSFVYRSKKWFTCSLGFARVLDVDRDNAPTNYSVQQDDFIPTYSIGAYFM